MTKPLAPHGTYARFIGRPAANVSGCRCDECRKEGRSYHMRREYLAATGRPLTVDATRTREHLQSLLAAGAGWNQLVAVSKSSSATISNIISGKQAKVRRSTESKFLPITIDQVIVATYSVASLGSVRKLRALAALGHSSRLLASRSGLSQSLVLAMLAGEIKNIRPQTKAAVDALFKQMAMTPGTNRTAAMRAARKGWAPPLAWDDDLDDPGALPVLKAVRRPALAA